MMNARVARPTGHHTMKPRIMSAIQAGFPNSSSFATIGMKASPLMLITFTLLAATEAVVKQVQDAVRTDAADHGRRSTLSHREVL
jgi:hypothetical protein